MKVFIFLNLILYNSLVHGYQSECAAKNRECDSIEDIHYNEIENVLEKIEGALKNYTPCPKENKGECSCYTDVIEKDLAPFRKGITREQIHVVSSYGTKYQIFNHTVYREGQCMFPSRCSGNEHFLKAIARDLPDMELVINCRDWPQIRRGHGLQGPVFSFSKTNEYLDIMYPAWSFWEGGPAISLYPTGIGRWDNHRYLINKASKKWPWDQKEATAFFRGSRTASGRDPLVQLSRKKPDLVDAMYTKNQAWKSNLDTLNAQPASEVSFEDHCKYKYLFNFRGVAASFRLKHLFLCKSLVFHVGNEWNEFFYSAMKPWVHYVPVSSHATEGELKWIIEFFKSHDDVAQEIAQRGYDFIWEHLRMSDVECYWRKLLTEYAKLLQYPMTLDKNLSKIA